MTVRTPSPRGSTADRRTEPEPPQPFERPAPPDRDRVRVAVEEGERCDRCHTAVAPANNAQILGERLKSRWPSYRPLTQPRHLLPVHQKQKLICTGYPELAQYIVGQPRSLADSYIAMLRPIVQELYAALVEEFGS